MPGPTADPTARESCPFAYAILRLVPRIERGERLNIGVVLFCRQREGYLGVRAAIDERRLAVLAPGVDAREVRETLESLSAVAAGRPDAGVLAALEPSERFGWLVAPSSTIIQPSEVHTGLTADPEATLEALFEKLVG